MDDTINYDETLKRLSDQVSQFSSTTISSSSKTSIIPSIKSPFVYYSIVPFVILILLWYLKPSVITDEVSIDGDFPTRILSYKKLFVSTIIITLIVFVAYFSYVYKYKN